MAKAPVVFQPAYKVSGIKEEISQKQHPTYEAQGVKYQGFYKDPYTDEVRSQTPRIVSGTLANGSVTSTIFITRKRFVIKSLTVYRNIQPVAAGSGTGRFFISESIGPSAGTVKWDFRHSNVLGVDNVAFFDFSGAAFIINNIYGQFTVEMTALPTVNDVVSFTIVGYEED